MHRAASQMGFVISLVMTRYKQIRQARPRVHRAPRQPPCPCHHAPPCQAGDCISPSPRQQAPAPAAEAQAKDGKASEGKAQAAKGEQGGKGPGAAKAAEAPGTADAGEKQAAKGAGAQGTPEAGEKKAAKPKAKGKKAK